MTDFLPPAGQKLVRADGGMDQTWYEKLRAAFKTINGSVDNIAALGTAAAKNIGTEGDSVPLLNTANTFSKAQTFEPVILTDAASIEWDWSEGPIARVTLGGNRTLAAPSGLNGKAGTWALIIRQDGTGTRTLAYASAYLFPGGSDPALSTAAGAIDVLTCVTDGSSICCSLAKAFA